MKTPALAAFAAAVLAVAASGAPDVPANESAVPTKADITAPADAVADKPADQPIKLPKFETTGSFIPFASTQTALPLTVIDQKAIEDSGVATNLLDLLHKVSPQFTGNGNIGNANAGTSMGLTAGGSAVFFRNLQTLVLVNGRRMAYAPSLAAGGLQFVDVNLIPMAAIERVEVLQDGASATYGTDAVSGVVNIILKTDYQGAEVNARYAVSDNTGHYSEHSFSVVGGTGSGRNEVTFSAELSRSDPLRQSDRDFSSPSYGTATFAGVINTSTPNVLPQYYVLNPALNAPPPGHTPLATLVATGVYLPVDQYNLTHGLGAEQQYAFNLALYTRLLQENERRSATLNFDHHLNDRVTIFGDVIYAATHTFSSLNAEPLGSQTRLPASNPSNPTTQTMQVRNRFVDHPRLYYYDSTSIRGILGARGTFGSGYKWETAVDYNAIAQDFTNKNLVDAVQRDVAIAQGLLALDAREQAPGAIEASGIFGTAWGKAHSTLATADARVSGDVFDLPAGPVGFAVGTEFRAESLKQDADVNSLPDTYNWASAPVIYPFHESRNVSSFFGEIRFPLVGERQDVALVRSLELSAAVRFEHYSDAGNTTVPKVSLAWRPGADEFLLRATYSRSFVAPTLYDLFGPTAEDDAATISFNQLGGGKVVRDFHVRTGANPNLRPSHSESVTGGFVWSPRALKGFSLTMDYFDVKQTDLVGEIGSDVTVQDVELNGPASPYGNYVKFGGYNGAAITAPGQLSADFTGNGYVTDTLTNIANTKVRGLDLRVEYQHGNVAGGRIEGSLAATYYQSYTFQFLPSIPAEETVGLYSDWNGSLPRWESYTTMAWSRGQWRTNVNWQHIPGVTDPLGDGSVKAPFHTKDYDAFDVAAEYIINVNRGALKRINVRVGVNNIFNRMPPLSGGTFTTNGADTAAFSPIGRLWFVEGKFVF